MYYLLENYPLFLLRYTLATPAPATAIPPAVAHGARKLNRGLLSWLQLLVDWCSWCWFAPLSPAVAGGGRRKKVRNGVRRLYPAMVHVVHEMERLLPELYHLCQIISQRDVGKMLVNCATL